MSVWGGKSVFRDEARSSSPSPTQMHKWRRASVSTTKSPSSRCPETATPSRPASDEKRANSAAALDSPCPG